MNIFRETPDGVTFQIRVVPRASRTELIGVEGGNVKMRVASPPVEGRANDEVVKFLAHYLNVSPARVSLLSGARSRLKTVSVRGVTPAEIKACLGIADG